MTITDTATVPLLVHLQHYTNIVSLINPRQMIKDNSSHLLLGKLLSKISNLKMIAGLAP